VNEKLIIKAVYYYKNCNYIIIYKSRYQVNDNKLLILLSESLYLIEPEKAKDLIVWQLLKNFDIWTAFLIKINLYDEQMNQILYIRAFKVNNVITFKISSII